MVKALVLGRFFFAGAHSCAREACGHCAGDARTGGRQNENGDGGGTSAIRGRGGIRRKFFSFFRIVL